LEEILDNAPDAVELNLDTLSPEERGEGLRKAVLTAAVEVAQV